MKRAILIGAGFSAESGLPLTRHLTAELKNWLTPAKLRSLNEEWIKGGGGYHATVLDAASTLLINRELHYENILGNLQTRSRQVDQGFREQFYKLYVWLTEMVYWLLYFRHIKNSVYFKASMPFYDGLQKLASEESPLWIFSLNHDLLVEMIAEEFGIPLSSGFSSEVIRVPRRDSEGKKVGELEFEHFSRDDLDKFAFHFLQDGAKGINLLKIHGALDVFGYQDKLDYLKIRPLGKGLSGWLLALKAANTELIYLKNGQPVKATNEIAFMDDLGEMQFLRRRLLAGAYKFDNRISQNAPPEFLKFFEQRLNYFTNLITIGYSLGDLHINKILTNWLELTNDRKLTLVEPHYAGLPETLKHLLPQIEIVQSSTTDFLDSLNGVARPTSQRLQKMVRTSARKFQVLRNGF